MQTVKPFLFNFGLMDSDAGSRVEVYCVCLMEFEERSVEGVGLLIINLLKEGRRKLVLQVVSGVRKAYVMNEREEVDGLDISDD